MEIPFITLPKTARVWIYQGDKAFNKSQREILSKGLSSFLQQWTAHGSDLKASFDLVHNQFIIIGLDEREANASGCSIDSLVKAIQILGNEIEIDFFNRELIGFLENEEVHLIERKRLKDFLANTSETIRTFNNLVSTVGAYKEEWLVPAATTWLKRYISPLSV